MRFMVNVFFSNSVEGILSIGVNLLNQYKNTVAPMFKEYINPMKDIADLVISENKKKDADINKLFKYINSNL